MSVKLTYVVVVNGDDVGCTEFEDVETASRHFEDLKKDRAVYNLALMESAEYFYIHIPTGSTFPHRIVKVWRRQVAKHGL